MKVAIFHFSLFGINTYVVYDEVTKKCAIIDPGIINKEEEKALDDFLKRENLTVTHVVNTHLHLDHAIGDNLLKEKYKVPVLAHKLDLPLGERMQQQAMMFGIDKEFQGVELTGFLSDGEKIRIGNGELQVIHVPGHSLGSVALYDKAYGFVIVGDALFNGSIGRTDLPGGDYKTLIGSIKDRLLILPDDTVVYPGHGEPTTIGAEKRLNPYLSTLN